MATMLAGGANSGGKMAIDPVTGQVILGAMGGIANAVRPDTQGVHNRYMDRRSANIEDLDRRAEFERRKARSPGSGAILQQLAQRLGLSMPDNAFQGSREAAPGAVSGKYMPGNPNSSFGQAYPGAPGVQPPPAPPRPGNPRDMLQGGGVSEMLRAYLQGGGGR